MPVQHWQEKRWSLPRSPHFGASKWWVVHVWSILFDGKNWKYVETDSDRGYVFDLKSFCSENEAVEYAKDILNKELLASKGNSRFEML